MAGDEVSRFVCVVSWLLLLKYRDGEVSRLIAIEVHRDTGSEYCRGSWYGYDDDLEGPLDGKGNENEKV